MKNIGQGLTSQEAKKRLNKYGPNVLPDKPPPSSFVLFVAQLKSPLVYVLMAAGTITFFLRDYSDTAIILFAVVLNTVLGFFQERRASRALHALKELIHPSARVVRDGSEKVIDVSEVVPGDLVVLGQGEKIPAGGKLIDANRFFVDEAILTGESIPVTKKEKDEVYMGTIVTAGRAKMIVEATGESTQMGKIALSVQEVGEDTPLKRQLAKFTKQLSFLVLFLVLFVFFVGLIKNVEVDELFKTAVALAVSAVPEGILVGLTIVLAIGMQRILKKKGLVRHLISAETLGGVTTICIDKTGTLTEGRMQVVDFIGEEANIAKQMILANDLDDPILIAAHAWARGKIPDAKSEIPKMLKENLRFDSIPFASENRFFASLNKWNKEENMLFVNGAPDVLLEWTDLKEEKKLEIASQIEDFTKSGKRVIGLARKKVGLTKKILKKEDAKEALEWIGILAFSDPTREGVKEALLKTKKAGIKLIVITGDYPQTAVSVMQQLDMETHPERILLGHELDKLGSNTLSSRLKGEQSIKLFARTTPSQKLKIVDALKKNGEVVAMMGDGVNDAPAINKADIGIVVGEASDVAKESADLVLLDSSFATIVAAIEEGRGIFDNVRKIILYLMSDSFEEIIAVVGTMLLGLPLPVTAAQILWINLVSDGFPDMALTVDPKREGIMQEHPRSPKDGLVAPWMRWIILIVSASGGLIALALFIYFYKTTSNLQLAQSIAFATLGVNSLVYVFSIRTLREPFWRENPLENKWLNLSVVAGLFLQLLPFMSEKLRGIFGVTVLSRQHWLLVFASSLTMFIIIEVAKPVFRRRLTA